MKYTAIAMTSFVSVELLLEEDRMEGHKHSDSNQLIRLMLEMSAVASKFRKQISSDAQI